MRPHHAEAIDELAAWVASEPAYRAVVVGGSVARGTARDDSDVDCWLVVAEDEYVRRRAAHDLSVIRPCAYEGGYVDGKVVSLGFLEAAAERGSEPTRASFRSALVVWSDIDGLQATVDRIPVYPEAQRDDNIRDFLAQVALHAMYFGPAAIDRGDAFLLSHSLTNTVLFAGRLLLAHNRVLYPCAKQLRSAVAGCADLPDGFVDATDDLLARPTQEGFAAYLRLVHGFRDWGAGYEELITRFMAEDEWTWLDGTPSVAQR